MISSTLQANDCLNAKGTPLLCPFYTADKKLTACLKDSCRGYSLTDEDLDATASNGQTYRAHAKSISSCTVGNGNDAVVYYRVDECKEGSRYQDGLCDVGCSVDRYPYTEHQGNLAGDMRSCVESSGERFGYYECNDGWTGGWKTTGVGKCELNKCSITDYPYLSDPNLEENRGFTLSCKIGGNTYYKYSNVDKNGNTLTSNSCNTNGHTLNGGVCSKRCDISNCTATVKDVNDENGNYYFSYNEWSCKLTTSNCKVGDYIYSNNVMVGIIAHMPDEKDNRLHVIGSAISKVFAQGLALEFNVPLVPIYSGANIINDLNGKHNTKAGLAYQQKMNDPLIVYPLYNSLNAYAPNGCSGVCGNGEWYLNAGGELLYLYKERYILYNISADSGFITSYRICSTEFRVDIPGSLPVIYFSGMGGSGSLYGDSSKARTEIAYPMLSFTLQ